mmetsp:Transcript_52227/g.152063  ORF Transcript_52227/g.152063 Transcript_52227/m.152063 type:complete len:281 (-) Transcript_52227:247-1089(-)
MAGQRGSCKTALRRALLAAPACARHGSRLTNDFGPGRLSMAVADVENGTSIHVDRIPVLHSSAVLRDQELQSLADRPTAKRAGAASPVRRPAEERVAVAVFTQPTVAAWQGDHLGLPLVTHPANVAESVAIEADDVDAHGPFQRTRQARPLRDLGQRPHAPEDPAHRLRARHRPQRRRPEVAADIKVDVVHLVHPPPSDVVPLRVQRPLLARRVGAGSSPRLCAAGPLQAAAARSRGTRDAQDGLSVARASRVGNGTRIRRRGLEAELGAEAELQELRDR